MTDDERDDEQNVHGQEQEDDAQESVHPSAPHRTRRVPTTTTTAAFGELRLFGACWRSGPDREVGDDAGGGGHPDVNFTAMQDVARTIDLATKFVVPPIIQPEVLEQLAETIDLSAIQRANDLILGSATIWRRAGNRPRRSLPSQRIRLLSSCRAVHVRARWYQLGSAARGVRVMASVEPPFRFRPRRCGPDRPR